MTFRFGSSGAGYIDIPAPQADVAVGYVEQGGSARAIDGTLLRQRTGAVKRSWQLVFAPWSDATLWQPFEALYLAAPGPYELYDPTVPNMLPIADRQGVGWVTSTGTAVTSASSMRLALSASPASAQTAITTSPSAANLLAVTVGATYTAAITVESASGATGALAVYGYTSTPSGTGTQQGSNTAISANGRYTCTFTAGAGIVYVELRVTRSAGTFNIVDPTVFPGSADPGKGLRSVVIQSAAQVSHWINDNSLTPNPADFTVTLEEV